MATAEPKNTLTAPKFTRYPGDGNILIVVLAGFGAESDEFFEPIRPYLERFGEVLAVNYGQEFDASTIIDDTVEEIKSQTTDRFTRIILIGASMGGKLGWEIWQQLDPTIARIIMLDVPFDRHDLPMFQRVVAAANSCLPKHSAGIDKIVTRVAFAEPDTKRLSLTDEQLAKIQESVVNTQTRNGVLRMKQQTDYLKASNMAITSAEKRAVHGRVVCITSTNGTDVVLHRWRGSWEKFFRIESMPQHRLHHFQVAAKHVAFDQYRDRFGTVVESAITILVNAA